MTQYHAVILDECGDEFGVTVSASSRDEAYDKVRDSYPENRGIVQLESPSDTAAREARTYSQAMYDDHLDDEAW